MSSTADSARKRITSTTVTETLPLTDAAGQANASDFYNRDLFEVLHDITMQGRWLDHMVRIYRAGDDWRKTTSPEGNKLKEEFDEDTIRMKWGGGRYWIWLYGPPEGTKLVNKFQVEVEGSPKVSGVAPTPIAAAPANANEALTMQLLAEIRELRAQGPQVMQQSLATSMEIMGTAYRTAAATVAGNAGGPLGGLQEKLMTVMIERMLNPPPPPDPLASINSLGAIAGAVATVVTQFKGSFTGGEGKTSPMDMLINKLPDLGEKIVSGMHELRLSKEADVELARSNKATRVIDQAPESASAPAPTAAAPVGTGAAAPAPAAAAPARQSPTETQVEEAVMVRYWMKQIVDRVQNTDATGKDIFEMLEEHATGLLDQLRPLSKEQILMAFAANEPLAQVAKHPRLPKMIDEFLLAVKAAETIKP